MTWVVKNPRRPDFCGCPPCPLCYDWADKSSVNDGLRQFMFDLLKGKEPTKEEERTLTEAAQAIHVRNLSADERLEAEIREADRAQHLERQIGAVLARPKPETPWQQDAKPCLDNM